MAVVPSHQEPIAQPGAHGELDLANDGHEVEAQGTRKPRRSTSNLSSSLPPVRCACSLVISRSMRRDHDMVISFSIIVSRQHRQEASDDPKPWPLVLSNHAEAVVQFHLVRCARPLPQLLRTPISESKSQPLDVADPSLDSSSSSNNSNNNNMITSSCCHRCSLSLKWPPHHRESRSSGNPLTRAFSLPIP